MPNSWARSNRLQTSALRRSALGGMHPQLRQTPPGRSSSTAATDRPSWAQRMAATYPPGPVPTTTTSNRSAGDITSQQQSQRLLEQPLDVLQEPRAHGAVHDAVIAGERELQAPTHSNVAMIHDR